MLENFKKTGANYITNNILQGSQWCAVITPFPSLHDMPYFLLFIFFSEHQEELELD
jgi:hypothetical protein